MDKMMQYQKNGEVMKKNPWFEYSQTHTFIYPLTYTFTPLHETFTNKILLNYGRMFVCYRNKNCNRNLTLR